MKTVILVRHATAVKRSPDKDDFGRSLKKTGRDEAAEMARRLKNEKARPKLFVSSPANRAFETASIFAKVLGRSAKKIEKREELYGDLTPHGFLELIRGLDDKHDASIVFGHDPSFTEFAQFLVPGFGDEMPKAGVLGVEIDAPAWKDVNPECAKMAFFFHPGDTAAPKPGGKRTRREIESRVERALKRIVEELGISADGELERGLEKTSARLAKKLASRTRKVKRARARQVIASPNEEEQG
jgi:phosphohistidine phosphatase